jgi:hypothetical protein
MINTKTAGLLTLLLKNAALVCPKAENLGFMPKVKKLFRPMLSMSKGKSTIKSIYFSNW